MSESHALSLKIIRLSKPSFVTATPVPVLQSDEHWATHCRSQSLSAQVDGVLANLSFSELLALPPFFGNIYLGETFSSFVSVNNEESRDRVLDIVIKAELQTTTQRFTLADTSAISPKKPISPRLSLEPNQSAEFLLNHEIKELGIHILVCSVHYSTASNPNDKKFFRKFYKFQVLNPLSVKTKVNSLQDGRIFLETQIQNITTVPMHLERMRFEASDMFHFLDLVKEDVVAKRGGPARPLSQLVLDAPLSESQSKKDESSLFKSYLYPQDTRQYLFLLVPKSDSAQKIMLAKTSPTLGKLDIIWSTQLGQTGRLQTSQLSRKVPSLEPFEISVLSQPAVIQAEVPFTLGCRIRNNLASERVRLTITSDRSKMSQVLLQGSSELSLGNVDIGGFVDFDLQFFPLFPGLHPIGGLQIIENISGMVREIGSLADVFVQSR